MDVRLVPVADAADELGKDVSGIRKRLRHDAPNPLLTDRSRRNVVIVDGSLVEDLEELIQLMQASSLSDTASDETLQAAEDQVELMKLELGEAKARSNAEMQAMADALEAAGRATAAAARAMRERASRD